jgi:20S proteasome subunit beta 1
MFKSHNPLDVDMAALKKGEVDLGTSMYLSFYLNSNNVSMAIKFKGGVILGADSRTTTGRTSFELKAHAI